MARHEQDREDLLAEATALVQRVELRVPSLAELVVLGVRASGELSIYLGAEPAYHFNQPGELRRAYWQGRLVKAENAQLVTLTRHRTNIAVELLRHEFSASEQSDFLGELEHHLTSLCDAFTCQQVEEVRRVPAHEPLLSAAAAWLMALPRPVAVAQKPGVSR